MAEANTNSNASSSNETEIEVDTQAKDGALMYSEEPCDISEEQLTDDLAFVPLDEELAIVLDEQAQDGAEQDQELSNVLREVEGDVDSPLEEELESAIKEALAEQEGSNDDDVADIEPAAGDEQDEPQSQIQNLSQADAQDLAQIEPEAGGERTGAAGISSSGRGYGFQSSFEAQGVIGLEDVGPIDPTALQYGIPQTEDKLFIEEDLPDLNPKVDVAAQHLVYEDGSVLVNAIITGESSNSTLTVTISGIPAGWSVTSEAYDASSNVIGTGVYNAAAGTWTITTSASSYNGGPIFTPPADSDVDALNLTYAVVENDLTTSQTGTASIEFDVIVDAVADQADIDALDNAGAEGATLAIDVTSLTGEEVNNGVGADDGSENTVAYEISGVPAGFTLSAGTEVAPGSGVFVLTAAELAGLSITPNDPNFSGSISLVASVHTTENTVTDTDFDTYNNDSFDSDIFTLIWTAQADKPALQVDDAYVKEDGSVFVPVSAQLSDTDGSEFLTVTIDGIPSSWGFSGAGWTQTGPDTYEIVVAAGSNYADGFTVSPPHDSDVDLSGISVSATATEISNNDTESVSDVITVYVDAVADVPNLNANGASGEEGTTIPLTITTSVNDTDGSEVIEVVKISNVPTGATLTAGTYNAVEDTWYVDVTDLAGLGINVPDGTTGTFTLNVESVAYEQNTSGSEIDLTDNRASAYDTIVIKVTPDDVPEIKDDTAKVDETDMAPTSFVTDTINASFGADTPGDVSGNGAYDVGSLMSNGVPVVVTYNAVTDTYTGAAGTTPVFTLVVQSNGQYTFTLLDTIDHPDMTDHNDFLTLDFGVTATDSEGDTTDAEIHIRVYDDGPMAVDDQGQYNATTAVYEGNTFDNDTESKDQDNDVTLISYGTNSVGVPDDGTDVRIDGAHGYLTISNDGEYFYTLFSTTGGSSTSMNLNPTAADASGIQDSITKDGITVSVANAGNYDISWMDTADGSGLGIDNLDTGDSHKVWPDGEAFDISFAQSAKAVTLTIGELGSNNNNGNHGLDFVITFADGTQTTAEQQFVASEINNGYFTFTIKASDYGTQPIDSVQIYSTSAGNYARTSFLLNDVEVSCMDNGSVDEFTYTLTDGDGDTDTAVITFEADPPQICDDTAVVDETNMNPDTFVTDVINANFGADTPGDISGNGTYDVGSLMSNGTPVVVTYNAVTDTYTGAAGTTPVFTLVIQSDGNYTFTLLDTIDHPDTANHNDYLTLDFGVVATDSEGEASNAEIHIRVYDDGPVAADDQGHYNPVQDYYDGNALANDTMSKDVDNDVTEITFGTSSVVVPAGGSYVSINGTYGTLNINNDGDYNYTLFSTSNGSSTDQFTYTLTDGDKDTDTALIKFDIDPPIIDDHKSVVDETDMSPTDSVTATMNVNFGADTPGDVSGNGTYDVGSLMSNGTPVVVTYNAAADTYTGTAGTTPVFTLVVQSSGQYTFTLLDTIDHPDFTDHNDYLTLDFGVTATDSENETTDAEIHIRVYDDGVTAVDDQGTYNVVQDYYDGNALANDDLSQDQDNFISTVTFGGTNLSLPPNGTYGSIDGTYGTLSINSDGDYNYTLFSTSNGSSTDEFTYTLMDGDDDTDKAVIKFDIDPPKIVDDTAVVDETDMNPTDSVSDSVNVNFGADTPGDVSGNGAYDVGSLMSNGTPVVVTYNATSDTYTGTAGTTPVFTLVIQSNGNYTFTLLDTVDHPDTTNHNDYLTLDFGVVATDSEGETANAEIHIKVYDDGPVAEDDFGAFNASQVFYQGNTFDNDTESKDQDNDVTLISYGTNSVAVPNDGTDVRVDGANGYLTISNDGEYTYTLFSSTFGPGYSSSTSNLNSVHDEFTYTLTDGDGDIDTALIKFDVSPPEGDLIVGQNVNDDASSTVSHLVNGDFGVIDGLAGNDILVGDAGGSTEVPQTQDYNFVFILDFSGSMGSSSSASSQLSLMKDAVTNLVGDFSNYQGGEIVVHVTPFATTAGVEGTFTITDAGALAQFEAYLDGLSEGGYTNYEDPLQDAIAWLNGSEPLGGNAITTTYFVSDGEPNYFINASGYLEYGYNTPAMNEILGTDGTNEVAQIQALSDDVIAVGINATTSMMNNLNQIDMGPTATNIDDASDLSFVFASTNPIDMLNGAGDDVIEGGNGNDLIFGDVLFTDYLADLHGLTTEDAAGWEVFERLENGESTVNSAWDRGDTVEYIVNNSDELSQESLNTQGNGRAGGDDKINGGAGDDLIYAQEGDDTIVGGAGNDTLTGGSGADAFVFENVGDGVDTITDFDASEGDVINLSSVLSGFDPLTDSITDFVMATTNSGDTTLYVDTTGAGGATNMVELVMLEGVTTIDLNQVIDTDAVV